MNSLSLLATSFSIDNSTTVCTLTTIIQFLVAEELAPFPDIPNLQLMYLKPAATYLQL